MLSAGQRDRIIGRRHDSDYTLQSANKSSTELLEMMKRNQRKRSPSNDGLDDDALFFRFLVMRPAKIFEPARKTQGTIGHGMSVHPPRLWAICRFVQVSFGGKV
jgi:hypothetical protein